MRTADWMEQNGKGQLKVNILVPVPVHGSNSRVLKGFSRVCLFIVVVVFSLMSCCKLTIGHLHDDVILLL